MKAGPLQSICFSMNASHLWSPLVRARLTRLIARARHVRRHGRPLIEDLDFALRLAEIEMRLATLEIGELRSLAGDMDGLAPVAVPSMMKILGTELRQRSMTSRLRQKVSVR